jgi:O-antigen/teichoic acid export membrane protein
MSNQEQSPSSAPASGRAAGRLSAFFLLSFGYVGLRFLLSPVRSRLLTEQLPKELYGCLTLAVTTVTFVATLLALGGYEFLARRLPGLPAARQKGWFSLLLRRLALPGWLAAGAAAFLFRLVHGPVSGLTDTDLLCLWADLGLTLWLLYRVFYSLGCGRIGTLRAIQLFQNDLWFVAVFAAGAWAAAAFSRTLWIWTAWLAVLALAVLAFDRHPGPAEPPPGGGVRDVLAFGLPLMPMMLGENMFRLADRYLLVHFRDMAVVAEYTLAMNIAMMAYVTGASLLDLVIPRLYAAANRRNAAAGAPASAPTDDMRRLFSLMIRHMTGLGAILGLALAFFRRDVFAIIAGPDFRDAAALMPWIAPIPLAFLLSMVASRALLAQDRSRLVGTATLGAALLNLAVDFAVVPRWGAQGAALATFGSMLCLAVFLLAVLRAHRWLVLDELRPVRVLAGILACALVYHLVARFLPDASPWLRLPLAALPTLPILFLSRIFTPSDAALLKPVA